MKFEADCDQEKQQQVEEPFLVATFTVKGSTFDGALSAATLSVILLGVTNEFPQSWP
jgi:hypothetical protein